MKGTYIVCFLPIVIAVAGCATQQQMLDAKQSAAVQAATTRAQFDMNCQTTEATVLSRTMLQPALAGPLVAGPERAEFTIGIAGCGQRREFIVICPEDTDGCFAANPR